MIDLHSHILPGVDDGAKTLSESLEMVEAAAAMGFQLIVATPHLNDSHQPEYYEQVQNIFSEVKTLAIARNIRLISGFEVRLTPNLPLRLQAGEQLTLGDSRALLVDLPIIQWPYYTESILFELQTAGFLPVLAHPERYPEIQKNPELGLRLSQRGVALQVTIGSFSGAFGGSAKRAGEQLLALGAVHLAATDAHSTGHRMAAVPQGLRQLNELVGREGVQQLLTDGPATILGDGTSLPTVASSKRSWQTYLRRLTRRQFA